MQVEIVDDGEVLSVTWLDGVVHRYHGVWLWDQGQDSGSRDVGNGQKQFSVVDIPASVLIDGAVVEGENLLVAFVGGHSTRADLGWLRLHHYDGKRSRGLLSEGVSTWGSELVVDSVSADFSALESSEEVLLDWLRGVDQFGFGHISGMPTAPESIFRVIDLFGYVRETNYGRLFEVRSEERPVNMAYTSVGLPVHTDNPYRDPVPTLQLLHALDNETVGGESVVVDGFRAVEILREESRADFDLLAGHSVDFEYAGDGETSLKARKPMIELSPEERVVGVRINNRSCSTLGAVPFDVVPDFYRAYRHLVEITLRGELEVAFKLGAGELFVVDNRRVLHGRNGFSAAGARWFQGAYADVDSLQSKIRFLENNLLVGGL